MITLIEHGGVYEWYKAGYGLMDPNNATDYNIVEGAVLYVVNLSKYLSPDWSSADWTTCVADVAAGKVLAHEDGDWVLGVLQAGMNVSTCWYTNITPACQVVVAPQPGTFGYIIQSSDMLWTVNTGNSQQLQNQMKFVEFVAGKQGQSIFCPIKGCVAVYPNEPLSVYKYPASVGEQEYWYYVEARKGLSHVLINLDQSVFYGSIAGLPNPPSDIYVTVPQLVSQGILPNGSYNWPLINKYIQMVFWLQNQRKQFFQGWYMGLPGMPAGGFWPPWAQGTWAQAAAPPPITPVYITVISVPQELPTTPSYSS
ncbi:MAG: hypothetical protein TU35_009840 [Thermoproteus sp. AZ2]|jgi:glucose/arabinose transport system substrate-binding protein|uniref:Uncharacterized protein n=1 Tax=Thermoproteus sp. AZ2 TaxID=1609232 RepID=A0ACC6V3B7_9CREN